MPFSSLPANIRMHLESLIKTSELPDTNDFREILADTWNKKCLLFEQQAGMLDMEMIETFSETDPRGVIVLTYSGSILSIGPLEEDVKREVEYASISLRSDVPKTVSIVNTALETPVKTGSSIIFSRGQLKKTSAVYKMAVCSSSISTETQKERIREGMIFLTNGFMKINRSIYIDKTNVPDQFTAKSMARYIAKKYDITGTLARKIIDDYILLIETGMMLGESVPLGRIGRLSLKQKGPQKARIIRHPETGEEITVKAKPPVSVPKMSFSTHIKEKAASLKDDTIV